MTPAKEMRTVAIVGVGLIGGSFALAIRKAGFEGEIIGVSSPRTTDQAIERGVIDRAATLESACAEADFVYLATPIFKILESIPSVAAHVRPGTLVTDAGSTKTAIVELAEKHFRAGEFLGGHPMAGKASRGVESAEAGIFAGRSYVLTPSDPSDLHLSTVIWFVELLKIIGCRLFIMDHRVHDNIVSVTSHLPQLASTALAKTVADSLASTEDLEISGPGLADMTRLAGSSYEIWRDILATNGPAICASLNRYIDCLQTVRDLLQTSGMAEVFEQGGSLSNRIHRPGKIG